MEEYMKINEIASLMNTTTAAIRFYESKNIIHPVRNEKNQYRGFTQEDVTRLFDCKLLQNVGFSLAEIAEIITSTSLTEFDGMMKQKEEELEREITRCSRVLEQMRRLGSADRLYEHYHGKYYLRDSPHVLMCPYAKSGDLNRNGLSKPFYKYVIENHNVFRRCLVVPRDSIGEGNRELNDMQGYSIEIEKARELGISADEHISELRPRRCVYTVISVDSKPKPEDFAPAYEWMRAHGFELAGDILAWTLKIIFDNGNISRLYSVWLPVE